MTPSEAIWRIETHNRVHSRKEPFAIYITEALAMAIDALGKQVPKKPFEVGKYGFGCPCCNEVLGLEKEDIYIYEMTPPKHCEECGQALDWSE